MGSVGTRIRRRIARVTGLGRLLGRSAPTPEELDPPSPTPGSAKLVRVMTYNIHHGRGTDRRYDLDRIAEVIRSAAPDIVALQEIERFRHRTKRDDQPALLARKLGMHHTFAPVCDHSAGEAHSRAAYGLAILSRHPILNREHFNLTFGSVHEPRGCLHATIGMPGTLPIHVFNVHLGLRYRERHYQMERLLSENIVRHERFGGGPRILLGDFNNWWPVKSARLVHTDFHNACAVTGRKRLRTFGKPFTFLCLDYIFTSRELRIRDCTVVRNGSAAKASDHRPVVCSLQLPLRPDSPEAEPDPFSLT